MIVAVDPGLRGCGVSLVADGGTLLAAFYVANPEKVDDGPDAWKGLGRAVAQAVTLRAARLGPALGPVHLVVEWPRFYPEGAVIRDAGKAPRKADPNALLQLAAIDGAVADALVYATAEKVWPATWKAQWKKKAHHEAILASLTAQERATIEECAKTKRHNVLDAVGIGRWCALKRRGVAVVHPLFAGRVREAYEAPVAGLKKSRDALAQLQFPEKGERAASLVDSGTLRPHNARPATPTPKPLTYGQRHFPNGRPPVDPEKTRKLRALAKSASYPPRGR
jgi:hypothetical protein